MALDFAVSRAVFAARLLERAAHAKGGWTITWGPHTVEAVREETPVGITFTATFPEVCYLEPPDPNVVLRHNGEVVSIKAIDHPGDTGFTITWALATEAVQA
jgi:hypothetical protein